jgi:hypothetical protein
MFCGAFVGLFLFALASCETSSDGKEWVASPNAQQQITQVTSPLESGQHKVCSGVSPNQFRDSIVAPIDWSGGTCQQWAASIGASTFQLGCMNQGGFGNVFSWCTMGTFCTACGW